VRPDLEQVFRNAYPRVVAVAARVLGSRAEAEDVAQEVFLSFSRSSVPAGEATGWLSVAAAHTALNALRSGRRRTAREEAVRSGEDVVAPDVADAVVALDDRRRVRAPSSGCPAGRPSPSSCVTAACPTPRWPPPSTSPPAASAPPSAAPRPPFVRS
jgi:RNA polymerase sigma-70 factor (ECF subfamily)